MTPDQLAAWRGRASRPRRTVPLILDGELRGHIEELVAEREMADAEAGKDRRLGSKPRTDVIDAELDAAYAQAAECTLQVVVEGLAGTPWAVVKGQHPLPAEPSARDKLWGFDVTSAREQVLRAAIVGQRGPEDEVVPLDAETVEWLLTTFASEGQLEKLYGAALMNTRGDDAVPLRPTPSAIPTSDGE